MWLVFDEREQISTLDSDTSYHWTLKKYTILVLNK